MSQSVQVVCPGCGTINRVPPDRLAEAPRCGGCRAPLFMGQPMTMTEERFRRHLRHDSIPLLVDFWASWCGPCHAMAPEFKAAARMLEPRMRLAKISTEEAPGLAAQPRITSIPTLAVFAGGREVVRRAGAVPARQIAEWARAAAAAVAGAGESR